MEGKRAASTPTTAISGRTAFEAIATPAMSPPPAHGDQERLKIRKGLEHLYGNGALAGHDLLIVIGMDKVQGPLSGQLPCKGMGLSQSGPAENDVSAKCRGALNLYVGRMARHDDSRGDAQALGMISNGLGMVSGGHGYDTGYTLVRTECQELHKGTTLLEGGRELVVFKLQNHFSFRDLRERVGSRARRVDDASGNGFGCFVDVL